MSRLLASKTNCLGIETKNSLSKSKLLDGFRRLILIVTLPIAQGALAQGVTMPQEYAKYVGRSNTIETFADFGDRINLRDGKLLFRATDIEIPGIGPMIRFTRSYDPDGLGMYFHETSGNALGAWEIAIPRIRTITNKTLGVSQYSPVGWQVSGATTLQKNARCSRFSAPDRVSFPSDAARGWEAYEWWDGYHLVDDTGNDRPVMKRANTTVRTDMPLMTSDNWLISCLPATTNGQPGEAFFAVAPDGTKYWFTELVYRQADNIEKPLWSNSPPDFGLRATSSGTRKPAKGSVVQLVGESDFLERDYASMLVTRVEDRFGNWVTYHYTSGRLDSIDASDGRHLGIAYSGTGYASVTANAGVSARTWQYAFSVGTPSSESDQQNLTVTRPDGSKWQYMLHWQVAAQMSVAEIEGGSATCPYDSFEDGSYLDQTVISPFGATLQLRTTRKRFGRSYVFKDCLNPTSMPDSGIMRYPNEWFAYAVTRRTVTGPGLPGANWNYSYSPPNSSWSQNCPTPMSCAGTVWTDIVAPDGGPT